MADFVCPSCGSPLGKPETLASYNVRCRKCGKMVHTAPKRKSNRKVVKHKKSRKKGVLIVAALGTAAVIAFVLVGPESRPAKTQLRDLNQDVVDNEILTVGISALEDHGWTVSETAFYIETRIGVYRAANKEASDAYHARNATSTELTATSTASDIQDLSATDLREAFLEIADREIRIQKLEQILADYRQGNP